MTGRDYIQLQNQGNIISNVRLLYEMMNSDGYADENGYFSKSDVAEIACNALILTTGSKVGEEVNTVIHAAGDQTRNSPLQNAKARMQLLRALGLVSTDYGSEIYAITRLGKLMVTQILSSNPRYALLRELFMHITSATEIYDHNCDITFNCWLGYGIMYAFSRLDYKLSTDEMPVLTSYDIKDIDEFVNDALSHRMNNEYFTDTHPHFPKTAQGTPLRNVSNLTRAINQILKICGIIKPRVEKSGKKNYYVCTEEGKAYVDQVIAGFNELKFMTSYQFRNLNNITKQKEICIACYENILVRANVEDQNHISQEYRRLVFSPFQMLPETNVEWFLGGNIRKHPQSQESKILSINSQITLHEIRVKDLFFNKGVTEIDLNVGDNTLRSAIIEKKSSGMSVEQIAESICESYKLYSKETFYPLVHSLFRLIGLECAGEVGRYDAMCMFESHVIPVEIKSFIETHNYNLKGLRQAVENKIMSYNAELPDDMEFASLVVGYDHPSADNDIREFIDSAYDNFGIRIIASDLNTLATMAVKVQTEEIAVNFESLLKSHGILKV